MFDIGWQELFIIGVLAIIVVGPKELPQALRTVMRVVRKARSMAREFQSGIDDMVREAELDDIKKEIQTVKAGELPAQIERTIDPNGEITREMVALESPDTLVGESGTRDSDTTLAEDMLDEADFTTPEDEERAGAPPSDQAPGAPAKASG